MHKKRIIILTLLLLFLPVVFFSITQQQDIRQKAAENTSQGFTDGFVSRQGTQFYLEGKPFTFVGFNLFDAASTTSYKCGWWERYSDQELDSAMQYMRQNSGATVLRFWAYQTYTKGGTDWTGVDKVIALAKKNGMKVLPALEDGPGYCTTGAAGDSKWKYNGDTWYTQGYKVPYGSASISYREYVKKIVARYKDEPAIFGWMMMNEADTSAKNSSGKSVLVDFANDIGPLIKSIDPNHLVTVGTQSNGASGATGPDFAAVYGVASVDFGEAHDWSAWGWGVVTDPLPGSLDGGKTLPSITSADCQQQYKASIACSVAFAKSINKPMIIGESGIAADNTTTRQTRAQLMDGRLKAAFDNGVSGYLVWQFNKVVDTEKFDVLQSTSDPLFAVMKKYAGTTTISPTTNVSTATPIPTTQTLPTNTPVASGTNLLFTLKLHGLGNGGDTVNPNGQGNFQLKRAQRIIRVEIYNTQNVLVLTKEANVQFDGASGKFTGTLDVGTTLPTGTYTIKIASSQFLRTSVPGIQKITANTRNTITETALTTGDINGDNQTNVLDYNILDGCYADLTIAKKCTPSQKLSADLNDDDAVNLFDYNLFIREISNRIGN